MLVLYNRGMFKKYFETEYTEHIILPNMVYQGNMDIDTTQYEYVVGNELYRLKNIQPYQKLIDVDKLGLSWDLLEQYDLEAIIYVYNNWYIPNDPYMQIDKPTNEYMLRDMPENPRYVKILLEPGNKRFNHIKKELMNAVKQDEFIGAIWPTCHYMADTKYMYIIYTRFRVIKQNEIKPIQK